MSKQKNKKDPIEDFFEEKAWDYDISYNQADWEKLEKQLDVIDKEHNSRLWRRGIAAGILLLFSLLGYFTYQNYSQIKQISELLDAENQQSIQQLQNSETGADNSARAQDLNTDPSSSDNKLASGNDRTQETQNSTNSSQTVNGPLGSTGHEETNVITKANKGAINNSSQVNSGLELFISELSCTNCGLTLAQSTNFSPGLESIASAQPAIAPPNNHPADNTSDISPLNTSLNSPHEPSNVSRFSFGFLLGPDLSTTQFFSSFYEPGYTIGIHAEYHITNRLSFRAGVQQSKVRYTAGSNDYTPPNGYWTNGIAADQTLADCVLLDIPISFKYSFLQFKNSRLYTTAGLSSYIMLNEEYQFNYDDRQTGRVQSWDAKTGTRHWLSNASLSLGYELDIHRNWSVRAEPYIKIPLKEVGWGNVDLYSTGSFITLNYKL